MRAALICASISNALAKKKSGDAFTIEDFLPMLEWQEDAEEEVDTTAEQINLIMQQAAAHGVNRNAINQVSRSR